MKALILAAGYGKRLHPITNTIPKSMVKVGGKPLLMRSIETLASCGIDEVGIVTGHMAEYIQNTIGKEYAGLSVRYFENRRYQETNNIFSLYQALSFCDSDMLLLEADIIYQRQMIEELMAGGGECSVLVSPFNPETMDGTVVRTGPDGERLTELILGKWQDDGFDYSGTLKTVNMYRFSGNFLREKYGPLIRWYVEKMGTDSYYEKVLGSLIYYRDCDIRAVKVPEDMWREIDDMEDLDRAEKWAAGKGI